MPAKGSKGAAKQKPKEEKREETLQAVVLSDSYEKGFAPFALEKPRCLLPLANIPLIEYTLEFLASSGIQDIFLYCGAHTDQVEEYINTSRWKLASSPFSRLTLLKSDATSVGDAMRDLDKRDVITGDFILVTADVLCNIPLAPALAAHRRRRASNKNAIMTMLLRSAGSAPHRTKARARRPVFVIDPTRDRCLHYEEVGRGGNLDVHVDAEMLLKHDTLEVRADLIDSGIDICTLEVLSQWSDNFDYQSPRASFLFGVLKDHELNGHTIHTHIATTGYASRVCSLRAYDAVCKDVIGRWAYPLCPDTNLVKGQTYHLHKGNVYLEDGVVLARGNVVQRNSVIGSGTSIGANSTVASSVIGSRCRIGKNVNITESYIWDDVSIGDNTTVTKAIIANEVSIGHSCHISPSTLLSFGTTVAPNTTLPEATCLIQELATTIPLLTRTLSSASTSSTPSSPPFSRPTSPSPAPSISTLHSAPSTPSRSRRSSYHSDIALTSSHGPTSTSDLLHTPSIATTTTTVAMRRANDFIADAAAAVLDAIHARHDPSVIHLELLSQRLTADASDHSLRAALAAAFVRFAVAESGTAENGGDSELRSSGGSGNKKVEQREGMRDRVTGLFVRYAKLVAQMAIFDRGQPLRRDQVDWLGEVERRCQQVNSDVSAPASAGGPSNASPPIGERALLFLVKESFAHDVVEEEAVLTWWAEGGAAKGVGRGSVKAFVDWLEEDDDDEGDEDGDEEDEKEDDEDEDDD